MTTEQSRARWEKEYDRARERWVHRLVSRGATLATVEEVSILCYAWSAAASTGTKNTIGAAQRAARRAIRESGG